VSLPEPRIVLVEPQVAGNLGFVARLMANFGVREACVVGGVPWRGSDAERTGAMARAELESLRACSTLDEALSGCTHAVGFTARSGFRRDPLPLEDLGGEAARGGAGARPALVFGREDRGLDTAQCERCTLLLRIPTRGLGSFNLSHAVGLALYEWFRGLTALPEIEAGEARVGEGRFAGAESKERLARKAEEALRRAGFREPEAETRATLRRLLAQPMERRDLRMLERVLRHVRWLEENQVP
jgi:TrmH family RNA methyltransferase